MLRIRELRKEKGWSQGELASKTNQTQQTVQRHEKGDNIPPFDILEQYADLFSVSIDYLTCRSNLRQEILSVLEQNLVNLYRRLPDEDTAEHILAIMEKLSLSAEIEKI